MTGKVFLLYVDMGIAEFGDKFGITQQMVLGVFRKLSDAETLQEILEECDKKHGKEYIYFIMAEDLL